MKLIIAIILFVLAGSIFFLYTESTYNTVQTLQAQIDQYNSALDKAAQLQQLKQTLLAKYNAFNPNDIARLQTMLPDSVNNVGLILDLNNLASQYGLPLENVDVSAAGTSSTSGQTPIGAIGASNQRYESLTLKFQTIGTYDNFLQFLTQLQSSLRVLDLVSLTISPDSSSSSGGIATTQASSSSAPLYTYDITVQTYWLK